MKLQSAIKNDLFAADHRRDKIKRLGDPLAEIGRCIGGGGGSGGAASGESARRSTVVSDGDLSAHFSAEAPGKDDK